jgi:hypothetical protein
MPTVPTLPTEPTLNPSYNDLLQRWAASGHPSGPECEECGCDLTGRDVHDTGLGWVCDDCLPAAPLAGGYREREDFHADG